MHTQKCFCQSGWKTSRRFFSAKVEAGKEARRELETLRRYKQRRRRCEKLFKKSIFTKERCSNGYWVAEGE